MIQIQSKLQFTKAVGRLQSKHLLAVVLFVRALRVMREMVGN